MWKCERGEAEANGWGRDTGNGKVQKGQDAGKVQEARSPAAPRPPGVTVEQALDMIRRLPLELHSTADRPSKPSSQAAITSTQESREPLSQLVTH
uniref:Uncharacterized protein n=1 Tax=Knipowitschia caucasica TaxID=637954 RepID=A0AAV2JYQ5_KNICA